MLVKKGVEVFVQARHQIVANDDGVVICHVQVGYGVELLILEHKAERLHNAHGVYRIAHLLEYVGKKRCDVRKEICVGTLYPLLDHAAGYFLVIVVECDQLAAVWRHANVNVGNGRCLVVGREFLCCLSDGTLYLLYRLFCCFHRGRLI